MNNQQKRNNKTIYKEQKEKKTPVEQKYQQNKTRNPKEKSTEISQNSYTK